MYTTIEYFEKDLFWSFFLKLSQKMNLI